MLIGIIAAASGAPVEAPPTETGLVLDFEHATYSQDGVSKTQSDVLEEDAANWGTWDGTVAAGGLSSGQAPVLTAAAKADYLAGFTAVLDLITPPPPGSTNYIDIFTSDFEQDIQFLVNGALIRLSGGLDSNPTVSSTEHSQTRRVAYTVTSDHVALSVDGATAVTATCTFPGGEHIAFFADQGVYKKIRFIPPQADADLPALSAL